MNRLKRGWKNLQNPFGVKVNGAPIGEYQYRPSVVQVQYSPVYEYERARVFAGMSIAEWDALPGTPLWANGGRSKCDLIMLYRMSNDIPSAINDAQSREMERKANMHKKR